MVWRQGAVFILHRSSRRQERIFEKLLRENGTEISGGQGRILFVLWKNDNLTVSEISRKTSLAKNTVSIVVDKMVQKGIVERTINPDNRRQTIISLTEYARTLREKYEQVSQRMNHLFTGDSRRKSGWNSSSIWPASWRR